MQVFRLPLVQMGQWSCAAGADDVASAARAAMNPVLICNRLSPSLACKIAGTACKLFFCQHVREQGHFLFKPSPHPSLQRSTVGSA
jgi:hypothetical protein